MGLSARSCLVARGTQQSLGLRDIAGSRRHGSEGVEVGRSLVVFGRGCGAFELCDRVCVAAGIGIETAKLEAGVAGARVEFDGSFEFFLRRGKLALLLQDRAKIVVCRCVARIRGEFAQELTGKLMQMVGGGPAPVVDIAAFGAAASAPAAAIAAPAAAPAANGAAPWIESAMCTSCDECININPKLFAYDENRHAFIKDPKGGPYKDLVRAAEKCTAQVIHPGSPLDPNEKDLDKLIKRAAKYN